MMQITMDEVKGLSRELELDARLSVLLRSN